MNATATSSETTLTAIDLRPGIYSTCTRTLLGDQHITHATISIESNITRYWASEQISRNGKAISNDGIQFVDDGGMQPLDTVGMLKSIQKFVAAISHDMAL